MANQLDDPRPFADVLRDWMADHGLTLYAAAKLFGATNYSVVQKWLDGGRVTFEPALRRAMRDFDRSQA